MSKEVRAIVKETEKQITVYRSSQRNTWIDAKDFETEYKPNQLNFK